MRRSVMVLFVLSVVAILGAGSALANQRPDNCQRCGNEFNGVDPSSCGFVGPQVDAYRANGDFLARYDNRCFACTLDSKTFCTVDADSQAASFEENALEDLSVETNPGESEPVFVEPCNRGQCKKDYRECLVFCSENLCIIDCETRLQICLDECG